MMSLYGYADKAHPFFFKRNFLDTVSVLFSFLFVTEERMIQWKTKNLFYPSKGKLNTSTSVTGKESPKRLILAQRNLINSHSGVMNVINSYLPVFSV